MVGKTNALVLNGYGINCPVETAYAITAVGGNAEIKHTSEILETPAILDDYNFLVIPGGFSFGDDIGSGKVLSNRLRYKAGGKLLDFISQGKLVLGICNGFQVLVKMGLLPEPDFEQKVTITYNESGKFEDRWVKLLVNQKSPCIFTRELSEIDLPIRHGEGRFIPATKEVLNEITGNELHVMQYIDDKGGLGKYPWNPNGSVRNIAGICDKSGQIFGLMPHPEAYNHRTNHPCWAGGIGSTGRGLSLFRNAVSYIEQEW
ncbi:MAG: phosphoribosylformylglycinamidine synthase I [bacterium]|nr:phosphoribosylformylglycinamidine synthase I [bacterium]